MSLRDLEEVRFSFESELRFTVPFDVLLLPPVAATGFFALHLLDALEPKWMVLATVVSVLVVCGLMAEFSIQTRHTES